MRRLAEILAFKTNECRTKLKNANLNVLEEIHKLDHCADEAFAVVDEIFDEISKIVEKQRSEVLAQVKKTKDLKRKKLEEQLQTIKNEEMELGDDDEQEIIKINEKINNLNNKLKTFSSLSEPVDNFYLRFKPNTEADINGNIADLLNKTGDILTSAAVASNSTISLESDPIVNLSTTAVLTIADRDGETLTDNNSIDDLIRVAVRDDDDKEVNHEVCNNEDGTYTLLFTPRKTGQMKINATLFGRSLQNSPLTCEVSFHNPPVASFGSRGVGDEGFVQPCSLTIGE